MTKMDMLNQKTLLRVFRQMRNVDIGLTEEKDFLPWLHELQSDYMEEMICILEEAINE